MDHRPELGQALDDGCAYQDGVRLNFMRPCGGRLGQNPLLHISE